MSVKAKFQCSFKSLPVNENIQVNFHAVYGNGAENKEWSKYTPSATLQMFISNPDAYNKFEVGKEYYLTFEVAE